MTPYQESWHLVFKKYYMFMQIWNTRLSFRIRIPHSELVIQMHTAEKHFFTKWDLHSLCMRTRWCICLCMEKTSIRVRHIIATKKSRQLRECSRNKKVFFGNNQKEHIARQSSISTYASYLCSAVTLFLFLSTVPVDNWRKLGFSLYNSCSSFCSYSWCLPA